MNMSDTAKSKDFSFKKNRFWHWKNLLYKSVKCYNECVDMIFLDENFLIMHHRACTFSWKFAFTVTFNVISNRKVDFSICKGPKISEISPLNLEKSWNRKQLIIFRCTNTKTSYLRWLTKWISNRIKNFWQRSFKYSTLQHFFWYEKINWKPKNNQ